MLSAPDPFEVLPQGKLCWYIRIISIDLLAYTIEIKSKNFNGVVTNFSYLKNPSKDGYMEFDVT